MDSLEQRLARLNKPVRERLTAVFAGKRQPEEVYGLLAEFMSAEGKFLRPALCLSACEALGGNPSDAVPAAAAIEMFHNFTLIHDDIEDCSQMRRNRPCLHVKYGLPLALNAGDGLFMMVWQETLGLSGPRKEQAQRLLLSAFTKVLEGQALELGWYYKKKWDVSEQDYYRVVEGKTGALISACCEVGGLLGGAGAKTCKALCDFGMGIGVGFQIADDLLNIVGDVREYGKEIGGDVNEGKRTLLTISALATLPLKKRSRLQEILKNPEKGPEDVALAVDLLKESGAPAIAKAAAEMWIENALLRLAILPESEAKGMLVDLAEYITRRKR